MSYLKFDAVLSDLGHTIHAAAFDVTLQNRLRCAWSPWLLDIPNHEACIGHALQSKATRSPIATKFTSRHSALLGKPHAKTAILLTTLPQALGIQAATCHQVRIYLLGYASSAPLPLSGTECIWLRLAKQRKAQHLSHFIFQIFTKQTPLSQITEVYLCFNAAFQAGRITFNQ